MKLTLKNIWENKEFFIQICIEEDACKNQYKRLLNAKSKDDFMQVVLDNYSWVNRKITEEYDYAYDFFEGLAVVKLDDKYGLIDEAGNIFIPIIYDFASNFFEGLAVVQLNDKCGFIDKNGNIIVPIIYDYAYSFKEGLAVVRLNGEDFKINKQNERVAE